VVALAALASVFVVSPALAVTASASPVPVATSSTTAAAGCVPADPALIGDARDAFAFDLTDPQVTHFLTEVATATPSAAHDALGAIVLASETAERRRVDDVVDGLCPVLADYAAQARADHFISNLWKLNGFEARAKLSAIVRAVKDAVFVLGHRSVVSNSDVLTALGPFAAITKPVRAAPATCSTPNAEPAIDHLVELVYPRIAAETRSSGSVTVKVALTAAGDVGSVVLVKNETTGGSGTDALVDATIMAATETTYRPALVGCVPQADYYIFRANFEGE